MQWHFHESTGCPFWLEKAKELKFDPLKEVKTLRRPEEVRRCSRTNGSAAARCGAGCPRRFADKPVYVFETGGTTGIPKSRIVIDDFRIDYEMFSDTLPDKYFPKGANWLMLGPSGPRRLRLAVEHLCQYRGGICFCVDLDPRWVIKLIKKGWMEHLEGVQGALHRPGADDPVGRPRHQVHVHDAEAARSPVPGAGEARQAARRDRHHRHLLRRHRVHAAVDRFAIEEFLGPDVYMTPTYGNTLMGLACSQAGHRRRTATRSATTPRSRGP